MTSFTVALLQIIPCATIQENLVKGLQACEQAKELGVDLALFPEMWQIGYDERFMQMQYAIDLEDDFIQQFCAQAKILQMAIAITYLGKGISKPTNCVAIIDAQGDIILDYAKVHICSFEDGYECGLEAGNEFKVADLQFAADSVKLGAMTCFDREFPESARTLMFKGAEIILVPNACYLNMMLWLMMYALRKFVRVHLKTWLVLHLLIIQYHSMMVIHVHLILQVRR